MIVQGLALGRRVYDLVDSPIIEACSLEDQRQVVATAYGLICPGLLDCGNLRPWSRFFQAEFNRDFNAPGADVASGHQ